VQEKSTGRPKKAHTAKGQAGRYQDACGRLEFEGEAMEETPPRPRCARAALKRGASIEVHVRPRIQF
jgi:hypothetical protein